MELSLQQLLERLQNCDECQRIEVKESKSALGNSALETISAFSNEPDLGGGYLVLGLKKNENEQGVTNRYSIIGIENPDRIQCELATSAASAFNFQIRPQIKVECVDGKSLIIAFIPESFCREKPLFIKKYGEERGAYRRIGSSDQRCTSEDLDLLYQLRRQRSYETEVFPEASWEDISPDAIADYRKLRVLIDPTAAELIFDDRELLISLGHAKRVGGNIIPTLKLSEADKRALVLAREVGAITNQDYRQINGTHTLAASNALRHLRDLGLLMMKGSGSETYYQPVLQIITQVGPTPYIRASSEGASPYTNPLYKGLDALPNGFPNLPDDLKNRIAHLKRRSSKEEIEDIIIRLCTLGSLQPFQIGRILDRDAQYLRINFLSEMVKVGKLVYLYPDKPAHPQQAYKVLRTVQDFDPQK